MTNDVYIPLTTKKPVALPRQASTVCMDIQSFISWLVLDYISYVTYPFDGIIYIISKPVNF